MTRYLLCILLLSLSFFQQSNAQSYHERSLYGALTAGAGIFVFNHNPGLMSINFPYTVTNASGNATHQVFQSKPIGSYSQRSLMGDVNLEVGNWRHCVSIGVHPTDFQAYIYMGYGYNFYFDIGARNANVSTDRKFVIKPSFNIAFSDYVLSDNKNKDDSYLGTIDNVDKTVELLGHTSSPTFHYTSGKANTDYHETSKTLDLYYGQTDWVFIPEITLSDNQYKHIFRWELNVGYHIPFYEEGGIRILQNDWHEIKSPKLNGLGDNGAVTTYNQKVITSSPYKLSGFFVSATIGFNISDGTIGNTRKNSHRI